MNDKYFDIIDAERCRRDFYIFIQEFWDVVIAEQPVYNWHIKYLCKELQEAAERVFKGEDLEHDLLINIPPGTTKTTIAIVMFPCWIWVRMQTARILSTSYAAGEAQEKAVLSKDIIKSEKFQRFFPDIVVRHDIDSKTKYKLDAGGERKAIGLGGGALGGHYHFILNDDPLNIKDAESKIVRESTNSTLSKIATTRKVDKKVTLTVTIMQRLHEDDPSGMLLSKEGLKLKHINLPARDNGKIKPPYLALKYVNGLLDPIRLDETVLNNQLIGLGSYDFAGQFMQEPAPDEGGMIKKQWFNYTSWDDFKYKTEKEDIVWNFEIDGAFTEDKNNAQTAVLAWCEYRNVIYIRNVIGVWEETNDFLKTLLSYLPLNGYTNASRIYIENKASGIVFLQVLKNQTQLNVISEQPKGSKEERVKPILPILEAGRVVLIEGMWNEDFVSQCGMFPRGKLKDKVDCLSAAVNRLSSKENEVQSWSVLGK